MSLLRPRQVKNPSASWTYVSPVRSHSPWNTCRTRVVARPVADRGRVAAHEQRAGGARSARRTDVRRRSAGHSPARRRRSCPGAPRPRDWTGRCAASRSCRCRRGCRRRSARSTAGRARPAAARRPTRPAGRRRARRSAGRRAACWRRTSDRRRTAWHRIPWPASTIVSGRDGIGSSTAVAPTDEREEQRVPEPVREERLRRGQAPVVRAGCRGPGRRTSRRRPRWHRAGASRPSACRWSRTCRARTPASRRSYGRPRPRRRSTSAISSSMSWAGSPPIASRPAPPVRTPRSSEAVPSRRSLSPRSPRTPG